MVKLMMLSKISKDVSLKLTHLHILTQYVYGLKKKGFRDIAPIFSVDLTNKPENMQTQNVKLCFMLTLANLSHLLVELMKELSAISL